MKILIIMLISVNLLFSCGCIDSGLANQGAEDTNGVFDDFDEDIADLIKDINSETVSIQELEIENEELLKQITKSNVLELLEYKKNLHDSEKINEIKLRN